jgi:hypothetical protein
MVIDDLQIPPEQLRCQCGRNIRSNDLWIEDDLARINCPRCHRPLLLFKLKLEPRDYSE